MSNHPLLNLRPAGLQTGLSTSLLLFAAALSTPSALAQQVGPPVRLQFQPGILSDVCTITHSSGSLGASENRLTISSSASELTEPILGLPRGARVEVTSNLGTLGRLTIDSPTLTGGSPATQSLVAFNGGSFSDSDSLALDGNGSLSTTVHVKFTSDRFATGTYQAEAVATCST